MQPPQGSNQFARVNEGVVDAFEEGVFDRDPVAGTLLVVVKRSQQFGERVARVARDEFVAQFVVRRVKGFGESRPKA